MAVFAGGVVERSALETRVVKLTVGPVLIHVVTVGLVSTDGLEFTQGRIIVVACSRERERESHADVHIENVLQGSMHFSREPQLTTWKFSQLFVSTEYSLCNGHTCSFR